MGTGSYNIIPDNESHCVWMDAGLVNYKLCDKNFECDGCPFDRVMRTEHHPFAERAVMQSDTEAVHTVQRDNSDAMFDDVIHHLIGPLKRTALPNDRLYFSNHSWLQKLEDGRCRIGLNGYVSHLVQPIMAAIVSNTPSRIEKDSPFAWFIRDDQTYTIHSSVAGIVTETNGALSAKPSLVTSDPYDRGWLITIDPRDASEESARYFTADDFRVRLNTDISKMESLLLSTLAKQRKEIGTSMFDGGFRIETIEQFIGEKRYDQLLSRLFRPHSR